MSTILEKIKNISKFDYINYLILLYAFTLSFPSEIKRVVAILMIILWLTDRTKYDFKLPKTSIFLLFGIFIAYSSLSYFWSDVSLKEAFDYIKRYWYYLPIFIIFKYQKKEYFEYAISLFFLGMLISEILSYGNFFNLWQVGLGTVDDPIIFMQHTLYSIFLSITSIFLLIKIIYEKNKNMKFFYTIFFSTVTVNLLINSGRTGYFTLSITILIMILSIYKINIKIICSTILLICSILFCAYNLSPNFYNRIQAINNDMIEIYNSNYNSSIGARIGLWIVAKEILNKNPLIGAGVANNINKKNIYISSNNLDNLNYAKTLVHFHNNFLEILTQFGIIGFSIFLYMIVAISRIKIENPTIRILKISTISIFVLGSFTDMLFYLNDTMCLFAFIVGVILSQYKFENEIHIKN